MEEDIALANIALDQLGAARLLLSYAGELEGAGRDEDALAYLRDDREFRNALLVELPNGDFAVTMAKLLFLAAYQLPLLHGAGRLRGRAAGRDRRPRRARSRRTTWTTARCGWCGSATAPRSRTGGCRPRSTRSGRTPTSCSPRTRRRRSTRPRCGRRSTRPSAPVLAEATLTRPADGWAPGRRPGRRAHRAPVLPARRDAGAAPRPPRSDLVSAAQRGRAPQSRTAAGERADVRPASVGRTRRSG